MATFSELGKRYFERLISSINPEKEFERILGEIKHLTYTESGLYLSNEDKAKIIGFIIENIEVTYKGPKRLFEQNEIIKAFSNDNYLELIDYIKSRINK